MIIDVADATQLAARLSTAVGGQFLVLQQGNYGALNIKAKMWPVDNPLRVIAADPCNPPVFTKLRLQTLSGIRFENVVFDYTFTTGEPKHVQPFLIDGCNGVNLAHCIFSGDVAKQTGTIADGYPNGYGLNIRNSQNIVIEGCRISQFVRGVVVGNATDVVIRNNDLFGNRSDGLNFSDVQRVLVENNTIRDFNKAAGSTDHPDMIQFWTNGTTQPSTDITIRGNLLSSGQRGWTQSIFMRNEEVDTGRAGREMFYRNVLIEENAILNAHAHGITVGETDGLVIRKNTLVRNRRVLAETLKTVHIPKINVALKSVNVTIESNVTERWTAAQPGWSVINNVVAQDLDSSRPGFYSILFTGNTGEADNLIYHKEGPLYQKNIGSSRLQV